MVCVIGMEANVHVKFKAVKKKIEGQATVSNMVEENDVRSMDVCEVFEKSHSVDFMPRRRMLHQQPLPKLETKDKFCY